MPYSEREEEDRASAAAREIMQERYGDQRRLVSVHLDVAEQIEHVITKTTKLPDGSEIIKTTVRLSWAVLRKFRWVEPCMECGEDVFWFELRHFWKGAVRRFWTVEKRRFTRCVDCVAAAVRETRPEQDPLALYRGSG